MKTSDVFRFKGFRVFALFAVSVISALGFLWPFIGSDNKSGIFFWIATPLALFLLSALIVTGKQIGRAHV